MLTALLVFAILKLHGMLNLSSCGSAYTDSVRFGLCGLSSVHSMADCYQQIISTHNQRGPTARPHSRTVRSAFSETHPFCLPKPLKIYYNSTFAAHQN